MIFLSYDLVLQLQAHLTLNGMTRLYNHLIRFIAHIRCASDITMQIF